MVAISIVLGFIFVILIIIHKYSIAFDAWDYMDCKKHKRCKQFVMWYNTKDKNGIIYRDYKILLTI